MFVVVLQASKLASGCGLPQAVPDACNSFLQSSFKRQQVDVQTVALQNLQETSRVLLQCTLRQPSSRATTAVQLEMYLHSQSLSKPIRPAMGQVKICNSWQPWQYEKP